LNERAPAGHGADHGLKELKRTDELQRGHLDQLFGRGVEERLQQSPSCRVHGDRYAPHTVERRSRKRVHIRPPGDVAGKCVAVDFARKTLQFMHITAGHQHLRTLCAKALCDALSHVATARRAQHHRGLSVQASHIANPGLLVCRYSAPSDARDNWRDR
jgi:hypothetical protein